MAPDEDGLSKERSTDAIARDARARVRIPPFEAMELDVSTLWTA